MVTVIKAGNALPTLRKRTRGIKKGQDLPTEHAIDQDRSPSLFRGSFVPLCYLLLAILDSKPLRGVPFSLLPHWQGLRGQAGVKGSAETGALAGKA